MLSLTPYRDIRPNCAKNGGGMWPQCGANRRSVSGDAGGKALQKLPVFRCC
jgi:hypothetical protein